MNIKFESTPYLLALKENENFKDDKKICDSVKKELHFKYGDVSYHQFNEKFNPKSSKKDWLSRTITALPRAIWAGVIETIYHLAAGILIGIRQIPSDQGQYLKIRLFFIARNLQESYGWLTSLFNERYGQFHVQESQFQKACYSCFTTKDSAPQSTSGISWFSARSSTLKYGTWVDEEASKISLLDYKGKTPEERQKLIQKFYLNQMASSLPNSTMSLDGFVDQANDADLQILTFEDLIIPLQHSKLKFALMNDEQFNALTIGDVLAETNKEQLSFIRQRLTRLPRREESDQPKSIDTYEEIKNIPLKDLTQLSADEVNKHKDITPAIAFNFFANHQIQGLKLAEMQAAQNDALFSGLDEAEGKARLALFDDQDVIDAIHKQALTEEVLSTLSDTHVQKLQLSRLNKDQLNHIFHWKSDAEQDLRRFSTFSAEEVQAAILSGSLRTEYQLKLLSDEQLAKLELSKLSREAIGNMFSWSEDNTNDRKRFANLKAEEVQAAILSGSLRTEYQLKLLSDEQLAKLELSKLSREAIGNMFSWSEDNTNDRKRFANLKAEEVQAAILSDSLRTDYQLKLLSDDQLAKLELSKLSKGVIRLLFPNSSDSAIEQKRVANFSTADIQSLLNNDQLSADQIELLSIEQIKSLNFSTLSQKAINALFPPYSVDHLREAHSYFGFHYRSVNGKVLENKSGKLCSYSEEQLQQMSKEQKQKNEELLAKLSLEERQIVESRLYQADPSSTRQSSAPQPDQFDNFFRNIFQQEFAGFGGDDFFSQFFGADFNRAPKPSKNESYAALGLPLNASKEDIKSAYKRLAMQYHPDKNPKQPNESDAEYEQRKQECEKKFKEISHAFASLMKDSA